MSEKDLKRLGQAVKDRRGELGLSQEEFCRRADLDGEPALSIKQLSRIEAGKVTPRAKTLGAIDRAASWPPGTAARIVAGGPLPTDERTTDPDEELRDQIRDYLQGLRRSGMSREHVKRLIDDVSAELVTERDRPDSRREIASSDG